MYMNAIFGPSFQQLYSYWGWGCSSLIMFFFPVFPPSCPISQAPSAKIWSGTWNPVHSRTSCGGQWSPCSLAKFYMHLQRQPPRRSWLRWETKAVDQGWGGFMGHLFPGSSMPWIVNLHSKSKSKSLLPLTYKDVQKSTETGFCSLLSKASPAFRCFVQ